MDGLRALAHVGPDATRLVSRKGNFYKGCAQSISISIARAVLDGKIVILNKTVAARLQPYRLAGVLR
jgi:ATP-dependent DNA ligase